MNKDRGTIQYEIAQFLPDNNNEEISAADIRQRLIDITDSFVSKRGDSGISALLKYSSALSLSNDSDIVHKKYVDDQISSSGGLKRWSSTKAYQVGDFAVTVGGQLWMANTDNINEEPGSGSSWTLQITNTSPYDAGWSGSLRAPTQAAVYNKIESVIDIFGDYLPLAGGDMTGSINDASGVYALSADDRVLKSSDGKTRYDWENSEFSIGVYGHMSETNSGLAFVIGNSLMASQIYPNTLVKTSGDTGLAMLQRYDYGFLFSTNFGGATGTTYSDTDSTKISMQIKQNHDIDIPNGDLSITGLSKGLILPDIDMPGDFVKLTAGSLTGPVVTSI